MTGAVVLGASGFIGTRLVRRLAEQGVSPLRAVDIAPPRERLASVFYETADVRETLAVELCAGVDVIYNLAAVHRTPGHPPHAYYDANVLGALSATALAEATSVPSIVFSSSISVYGPSEQVLTEDSPLRPVSDYGRSKRMAELIHLRWRAGDARRKLVVVRPGVVFGPGERGNYSHLAKALRRGVFAYPGRRDTIKSGGYVDELLSTIAFALLHPEPEVVFNFAFPELSSTEEIVATFGRVMRRRLRPPTAPLAGLMAVATVFEAAEAFGVRSPYQRERVLKLVNSTRVAPTWLSGAGYVWSMNLEGALRRWSAETDGRFV